ncbi:sulfide/dihydroorotate dehydrogenase-like FAD/NAD-binding protein [Clostridium luticellarii]|jgi:NAD(P)H-flavin reductase|uniref:sulfide/dihydroorotate dehydrogenase-like FAD/NAD-binding protein n=1 Tax=Clostridium luticellarii TaxID=1691940 RepID=UPI002357FD12|nr:sulfide/dihydroorotate dehydrogenase-like FAD/NAD-binding protein [Clostridium luticellarii]MCI1946536.1 sulfide/dihydroorotate dehydrogenase-like FAD/NAD-binding protein [Clostridium luticellarii]MCI1996981.1 sulfide/dihydroorotate dehydrogenase-like FAD/NAD-binding protein [Clostridium luticellarii]
MNCIDAGGPYCPCHLAETSDCILCSQLSGKEFCQCKDWCGVCIYDQYIANGHRAKALRKTYTCTILEKHLPDKNLCIFTLKTPENLTRELVYPGSFIFLRSVKNTNYYDVPISIMEADIDTSTLKVALKLNGSKTKNLFKLNEKDEVLVRGPFSNGIMGLSNIYKAKGGTSLIIARGIGIAPSIPVIKKLHSNGNRIISIIDLQFDENFSKRYLDKYSFTVVYCNMIEGENLTDKFKTILNDLLTAENINLVHCSGPDILTYNILQLVDSSLNFSCCNNSKMNCGEGICSSCTHHYKNDVIKKLCKVQMDPRNLFKDRKFV